jgi:hypothetical protein
MIFCLISTNPQGQAEAIADESWLKTRQDAKKMNNEN